MVSISAKRPHLGVGEFAHAIAKNHLASAKRFSGGAAQVCSARRECLSRASTSPRPTPCYHRAMRVHARLLAAVPWLSASVRRTPAQSPPAQPPAQPFDPSTGSGRPERRRGRRLRAVPSYVEGSSSRHPAAAGSTAASAGDPQRHQLRQRRRDHHDRKTGEVVLDRSRRSSRSAKTRSRRRWTPSRS